MHALKHACFTALRADRVPLIWQLILCSQAFSIEFCRRVGIKDYIAIHTQSAGFEYVYSNIS